MIGFVRSTVSPSSSIISRSTPCVDGCWGPMLMIIVSSPDTSMSRFPSDGAELSGNRRTAPTSRRGSGAGVCARSASSWGPSAVSATRRSCSVVCSLTAVRSPRARGFFELHRDPPDAVVLAEWVTLPVVRHENPREIRVAFEEDAEHVEGLALHRLCTRVEIPQRIDRRVGLWDLDSYSKLGPLGYRRQHNGELEPLGSDPVREGAA